MNGPKTELRAEKNDAIDWNTLAGKFMFFCEVFSSCFRIHGRDNSLQARSYLSGLMGKAQRKNMERIEEDISEVHYDALHHFVSNSPWDEHKVMEQVAGMAEQSLGNHPNSALYLN